MTRPRDFNLPYDNFDNGITRWYHRLAARIIASIIINRGTTYQMHGPVNWIEEGDTSHINPKVNADINVSKYQLAHWILYQVGYSVCVTELMEIHIPGSTLETKSGEKE